VSLRHSLLVLSLVAITLGACWPTTRALWGVWTDPFGAPHGPLVGILSVWLLLRDRAALEAAQLGHSIWAAVALLPCSIAILIFGNGNLVGLELLAVPVLLFLAIAAALGHRIAQIAGFPLAYLYFAMPGWGLLSVPLQRLTVDAIAVLAPLIGIPVSVSGNIVAFPGGGAFEIAEACSGSGFLSIGLAVAAFLGAIESASWRRRVFLVIAMALVAIIANWIRVLIIVDAGYTTNMRHILVTRGHLLFGWALFAVVMFASIWVLARPARPVEHATARAPQVTTTSGGWLLAYFCAVAALIAAPVFYGSMALRRDSRVVSVEIRLPTARAPWHGPLPGLDDARRPEFVDSHSEWHVAYEDPAGRTVRLVALAYPEQRHGDDLLNGEDALIQKMGLSPVEARIVRVSDSQYREVRVSDGTGREALTWSVYDIGGRAFVWPLYSKLWYGLRSLSDTPYSVLFAFQAECAPSCDAARAALSSFTQAVRVELIASVNRAAQPDPILSHT
jgi:exosortase